MPPKVPSWFEVHQSGPRLLRNDESSARAIEVQVLRLSLAGLTQVAPPLVPSPTEYLTRALEITLSSIDSGGAIAVIWLAHEM